ncbi:hypothetical protein HZA99_05330 [Candidatus Woesearchaeota archaeon]|nr:hypothetical protein [Candidatus Woesearchaeota archaeon]
MRGFIIKAGLLFTGAVGGYETWDYTQMNPFHERTYAEEMVTRGAAPTKQQIENILGISHRKEYRKKIDIDNAVETLSYVEASGITLVIEHAGTEPITYVDRNADGFAEKHMIGVGRAGILPLHYCAPNTAPEIMYMDKRFHDPQAREAHHGFAAQQEYFAALMKFEDSSR